MQLHHNNPIFSFRPYSYMLADWKTAHSYQNAAVRVRLWGFITRHLTDLSSRTVCQELGEELTLLRDVASYHWQIASMELGGK